MATTVDRHLDEQSNAGWRYLGDIGNAITYSESRNETPVLARIRALHVSAGTVERTLQDDVAEARRAGQSWAAIAECLGISKQAAQQRYGGH